MNLTDLFHKLWISSLPDNVRYLSDYRLERFRKYPGLGYRIFDNWFNHKQWMINESKRVTKKLHNDRVLRDYLSSYKSDYPKGS